jgi:uncharacterized protein YcbX
MRVALISTAPVKGLGLNHPDEVGVSPFGVVGDRAFALVDDRGRLANGKRFGPLVRVRAAYAEDPESLVLDLPDGTRVGGEVALGEPVEVLFYGAARPATRVRGDYSAALSELAGAPLTLVRMGEGQGIDRGTEGAVSLLTTASLEALRRAAGAAEPVDGRRFRMTFTIDGSDEHDEDTWLGRRVQVGDAVVDPAGHIGRCAVTTQDPDTGVADLDTLKAIAGYRGHLATTERLAFGIHAAVVVPGRVAVGDPVRLLTQPDLA